MYEYAIISRDTDVELRNAVNGLVKLGWRPQGGVAVGYREELIPIEPTVMLNGSNRAWKLPPNKHRMYWVQAMIREGEQK